MYIYKKVSVHCLISAECPACKVQHLLLGIFLLPMAEWGHVDSKRHFNKGKVIGSMLKISHFMGCEIPSSQHLIRVEMLFTNFSVVHNIALSAADHDICSGAHFRKSELQKRNSLSCKCVPDFLSTTCLHSLLKNLRWQPH